MHMPEHNISHIEDKNTDLMGNNIIWVIFPKIMDTPIYRHAHVPIFRNVASIG